MAQSSKALLRPVQNGPVDAGLNARIEKVCIGLGQKIAEEAYQGNPDEFIWGPYHAIHTGWAKDEALRHRASSGGALSAVLVHLLDSGAVTGVVQTMANPDDPMGNAPVISRSRDEILHAAGSRYAPSSPLAGIGPLLDAEEQLAFVGKPCDVAALRALARIDPRVDQVFPVMLSFFCAGVPSLEGAAGILKALEVERDTLATFRYRGQGWPGRATATLKDGSERSMSYFESWGKILSRHVQHRCKLCADGAGAQADIVCADAWKADENGYPLFEEEDGVSLVVARTARGVQHITEAETAGHLALRGFDLPDLRGIQKGQLWRRRLLTARITALRLLGKPAPRYVGLRLREVAKLSGWGEWLKNFSGMIKRVLRGRM